MKTPLFASGVTQNSRSRSKSAYDAAVSKKPVPESAATAPSVNCQFASPTCVQPARLLPSNSVRHWPPPAGSAVCSASGEQPDMATTASATTKSFARMDPPESRLGEGLLASSRLRFPRSLTEHAAVNTTRDDLSLRSRGSRRRGHARRLVRVQAIVESVQADAESLGRSALVAIQVLERTHDELALDVANRAADREPLLPVRLVERTVETLRQAQRRFVRVRHDRRAQYDMPQLANVPRPVVTAQARRVLGGESTGFRARRRLRLAQKMVNEQRHVLNACAQRRQRDREHAEPVIQVFSQRFVGDCLLRIAIRRRNGTRVDGHLALASHRQDRARLEDA